MALSRIEYIEINNLTPSEYAGMGCWETLAIQKGCPREAPDVKPYILEAALHELVDVAIEKGFTQFTLVEVGWDNAVQLLRIVIRAFK